VHWHWVKGHAGDPHNEQVDGLATQARLRLAAPQEAAASSHAETSAHTVLSIGVSCRGSKGPGGWAVVLASDEQRRTLKGSETDATSNGLALVAATEGLRALASPGRVTVSATSDYLIKGASQWVRGWQQSGWRTKSGQAVQNRAEWEALIEAAKLHRVTWQLVKSREQTGDLAEAKRLAAEARDHM
jgi:ribonuclease HI